MKKHVFSPREKLFKNKLMISENKLVQQTKTVVFEKCVFLLKIIVLRKKPILFLEKNVCVFLRMCVCKEEL